MFEDYSTPEVKIMFDREKINQELPNADLDTTEEEFKNWSSLFQEIKKMITKERMRHKGRLENMKKSVKLTRSQKRLVQAESATIKGEITDSQE